MAGKQRSPRYPSLSLEEALVRARKIYDVEHTHPAPREVVAKHIGYNSLNGASLTALATLLRYGVLESQGDGVRVSDDAVTAFELPTGDPERVEAMKRMALRPELFSELFEQFGDRPPSEANLRHTLIAKKAFLPKAADEVIRVYRENLKLVGAPESRYNGDDSSDDESLDDMQETVRSAEQPRPVRASAQPLPVPQSQFTARSYAFDISIPREVKGELRIMGEFKKEDLERLRKALNGQLAMMEAALED